MSDLWTDTEGFLARKMGTGRLHIPLVMTLVVGLAYVAETVGVFYSLEPNSQPVINALILLGGYRLFLPFVIWFLFVFAFYALSVLLGGQPLMGHLVRGVGWGMFPLAVSALVWAGGRYYALRGAMLPEVAGPGIDDEFAALNAYTAQANGDPVYVASLVAGCVILVVSVYIWTNAVKRAANLSTGRAAVTVVVPTLVFVAWVLSRVV